MTSRPLSHPRPELAGEKIRLAFGHRRTLYGVTALVWLSGLLWVLVEKWKGPGDSEWNPTLLKIHGAVAMAFLLLLGSLWGHIQKGLQLKRNRLLGLSLLGLCLFLSLTGWMLYYVGDESLRNEASLCHWVVGLVLPVLLTIHILVGRKRKR